VAVVWSWDLEESRGLSPGGNCMAGQVDGEGGPGGGQTCKGVAGCADLDLFSRRTVEMRVLEVLLGRTRRHEGDWASGPSFSDVSGRWVEGARVTGQKKGVLLP